MRTEKILVGLALIAAALLFGCGGTDLVILHQSVYSPVDRGWSGAVLAPLNVEVTSLSESDGVEQTRLLRAALEQIVLARTGIRAGDGRDLGPGGVVVRPSLSRYDPKSQKEILHLDVQIWTGDGVFLDEVVIRDSTTCSTCPKPGEPGAPTNIERALREISAVAVPLSDYLVKRSVGGDDRGHTRVTRVKE